MGDEQAATTRGPVTSGPPRVVVGVDGSESSQAALVWALEEARLRQAVLHVVHAWQYPFEMAAGTYSVPVPAGEMRSWAEDVVDRALAAAEVDATVDLRRQVENGPPTSVLHEASRGAELLVVGTRGHGRMTGLFLGSVSQYLVVHAQCPVLVVHGPPASTHSGRTRDAAVSAAAAATVAVDTDTDVSDELADTAASSKLADGGPPTSADGEGNGTGALEPMSEEECLGLLAGHSVGRLVVVHDGMPLAFPVNYVLDGRTVAVRTDAGTKLDWATLGHVAFEVDDIDEQTHQGWSVLVQGIGRDVTDGVDSWSERVMKRELEPWAGGDKGHWIAVASPRITGRRILSHAPVVRPLSRI
ncbi:MAG TPA: universal stress protein [Acidimicrobiales bacterium]|nr:universal stress protein [Acidimicrobiales bacterium]